MKSLKIRGLLLLLLAALLFVSCQSTDVTNAESINGRWINYEFDKTFATYLPSYTAYAFNEDNTVLKVTFESNGDLPAESRGTYSVDGDKISIAYEDGSESFSFKINADGFLELSGVAFENIDAANGMIENPELIGIWAYADGCFEEFARGGFILSFSEKGKLILIAKAEESNGIFSLGATDRNVSYEIKDGVLITDVYDEMTYSGESYFGK